MNKRSILPKLIIYVFMCIFLINACNSDLTEAIYNKTGLDATPPVPGNSGNIVISDVGTESLTVEWTKATDNATAAGELLYRVYFSDDASADTADEIISTGQILNEDTNNGWTVDIASALIDGLTDNVEYHVTVEVRDEEDNVARYGLDTDSTEKHSRIFWTDDGFNKITRTDLDGTNSEIIITTGVVAPTAISVDPINRKIYFTDTGSSPAKIFMADLDGNNMEPIITSGLSFPGGIVVDYINNYLFWTDMDNNNIYRSPLPPTNTNASTYILYDNASNLVNNPVGIDIDYSDNRLYWTEIGSNLIRSVLIGGTSINNISISGSSFLYDVCVHDTLNQLFWIDIGNLVIQSSDYSGDPVSVLISSNMNNPLSITIDDNSNSLFWIDAHSSTNKLYKCSLNPPTTDAIDYVMVVSDVGSPQGIDIY